MQPGATLDDHIALWKVTLKKGKYLKCAICRSYKAINVGSMKYHYTRCGKVRGWYVCPHSILCRVTISFRV